MRIYVESKTNSLAQSIFAYSAIPDILCKYPYSNITLGCGRLETIFFNQAYGINNAVLHSFYGNIPVWTQYENIIIEPFDKDDVSILDSTIDGRLSFFNSDNDNVIFENVCGQHLNKKKKIVGVYYTIPHPSEGEQWSVRHLRPRQFDLLVKRLNMLRSDVQYVFFTDLQYQGKFNISGDNIIVVGPLHYIHIIQLLEQLDILIGVASDSTTILPLFANINTALVSTRFEDHSPIPFLYTDNIPNRLLKYTRHYRNNDNHRLFLYPEPYANTLTLGDNKVFSLQGIDESKLANIIDQVLNDSIDVGDDNILHYTVDHNA